MLRFLTLSAMLFATPAVAADRFDLVCQGEEQAVANGPWTPRQFELRVDLAARQHCYDVCDYVIRTADVLPDRIVLVDEREDGPDNGSLQQIIVDRRTGRYESVWITTRPIVKSMKTRAQCEIAPFKPFPVTKF